MKRLVLVLSIACTVGTATAAQPPRDNPPPSIENARRERELRAAVAAGTATKETYLELASLLNRQQRAVDAIEVLRAAAARARLIAEADDLRNRVIAMQKRADATSPGANAGTMTAGAPEPPPPPFAGFGETMEQTYTRLTPLRVGGNIKLPTKLRDVKPTYPAEAQASRVQGVVIIEPVIDPSGSIANARVLRSIPGLDDAALGAVSRWQFTPTLVDGLPVAVIMTVTVNFTLQ